MFSEDDDIERTGHREDTGQPCRPLSGESAYARDRRIGDGQQADIHIYFGIVLQGRPYSHNLDNFTPCSPINFQESGASISEVEPPGKKKNTCVILMYLLNPFFCRKERGQLNS